MNTDKHTARSLILAGTALAALLALSACGGGDGGQEQAEHAVPAGDTADAPAAAGATTIAGVTFTPPAHWDDMGPEGMRQAQYRLAPVAGDDEPAEVNVFYFGPESGGGVEANLQRWIGQMVLPAGADPDSAVTRRDLTVDGMPVHVVAVDGDYKAGGMRPMGGDGETRPGYRLVGVVVEGPQGSVFFKLTGPVATAQAMEQDLTTMVENAHK